MSGFSLVLSAVLLSLSFSSFNLWQTAWFGFVPLFFALENKSLKNSFLLSYIWGIIFWSFTIYWLVHVTLLGQIILIFYLAVFFGIFGFLVSLSKPFSPLKRLIFIPSCWIGLEYIRSYLFTGFPWAVMGFSQYKILPVIQISEITGAWGVSFLIVLINTAFYLSLLKKTRLKIILFTSIILSLSLIFGFYRLNSKPAVAEGEVRVSVIQGNIPQHLKWDRAAVNFILQRYKDLTLEASIEKPGLIVWPEAAVPGVLGLDIEQFEEVFSLVKETKIDLLTGAVSYSGEKYFNSAVLIDKNGKPVDIYHKVHLVPFGEFIPLKNIFSFLQTIAPIGDIEPGRDYTIFKTNQGESEGTGFGVLICFEDLFPELSRRFVKNGAKFLINVTNDAWYKQGSAPYQHFAASVFRAVENRVYVCRSANTGISGFIDPFGRAFLVEDPKGAAIFVKGYATKNIPLAGTKATIYNRYGDKFIIFCLLFILYILTLSLTAHKLKR